MNHDFTSPEVQRTLSILRVIIFEDASNVQLLKDRKGSFTQTNYVAPFSARDELKVLIEFTRLCQNKLDGYIRTAEGDSELLARNDLTWNQRNILTVTLEEK